MRSARVMIESFLPAAPDDLKPVLRRYLSGAISAHVAILEMLAEGEVDEIEAWLESCAPDGSSESRRIEALAKIFTENRERCLEIARRLEEQPDFDPDATGTTERIAHYGQLFDRLVGESPEASVAAYSLGREDVLAEATQEVVEFLVANSLVDRDYEMLEIGCGIGRFEVALSPLVKRATGIDISPGMVAVARKRCAALHNVRIELTTGLDLAMFPDDSFDLVLAVDSFPYIVSVGLQLVHRYFAETERVLHSGGHFVLMNYSYRDSLDSDRADVTSLAERFGFELLRCAERPFRLWNGTVFDLEKR